MKIRRGRSRIKTAVSCLIALVCAIGICYSGYKIIEWKLDSDKTHAQTDAINEATDINEVEDSDDTEIIANNEPPESIYWKYMKMKLLDIDFTELRKINNETSGWVQVGGTNINYPFVKTGNNDFYLNHSFDKTNSRAGWVFADFRNRVDGSDRNLILYAHGRYDATMFGTLRNILTSGWLNNPDNFTVRTVNDSESALWQVFSVYKIPTTSDYIQTVFNGNDEFGRFANLLRQRSQHDFNTTVSGTDNILTLSTCFSSSERVVLHAKLIKRIRSDGSTVESEEKTQNSSSSSTSAESESQSQNKTTQSNTYKPSQNTKQSDLQSIPTNDSIPTSVNNETAPEAQAETTPEAQAETPSEKTTTDNSNSPETSSEAAENPVD